MYAQYYKDRWRYSVKYNNQPLIIVEPRRRNTNERSTIYLIPEMCRLTGKLCALLSVIIIVALSSQHIVDCQFSNRLQG